MIENEQAKADQLFGGSMQSNSQQGTKTSEQVKADKLYKGPDKYVDVFENAAQEKKAAGVAAEKAKEAEKNRQLDRVAEKVAQKLNKAESDKPEQSDQESQSEGEPAASSEELQEHMAEAGFLDDEVTQGFIGFATEKGLSREDVSQLLKYQEEGEAIRRQQLSQEWQQQSYNSFSEAELHQANELYKQHADEELMDFMSTSGFGNHPAIIRFVVSLAKKQGASQ